MTASFTAMIYTTIFCVSGEPAINNKCGELPADRLELTILHSSDCDTMGEGCLFDYIADLQFNGKSIGRIEATDQYLAQMLLLAAKPFFGWNPNANDK